MCNFEKKFLGFKIEKLLYFIIIGTALGSFTYANMRGDTVRNKDALSRHIKQSNLLIEEFRESNKQSSQRISMLEDNMIETRTDMKWMLVTIEKIENDTDYLKKKEKRRLGVEYSKKSTNAG